MTHAGRAAPPSDCTSGSGGGSGGEDRTYRCTYEIDVDAGSPVEAAWQAYHFMVDAASQRPVLKVVPWSGNDPDGGEPVVIDLSELRPHEHLVAKPFRVAAVSENTNSFGLYGHILVARDGEAFQAGASVHHRRQQGETVLLKKMPGAADYRNWAELGFEIPEAMPLCPRDVLDQVWSESPEGP